MNKLASFCLLSYNQEDFIADAIYAAFNQSYSPLEIIISDDCSTDRTFEIIKELAAGYCGPHKIKINQNEKNLGIREHCNKVFGSMANGEYIIIAAGDDVSMPQRTEIYVNYFEQFPQVMSISCESEEVDRNLKVLHKDQVWKNNYSLYTLEDYCKFSDFIIYSGDSRGMRRSIFEKFPVLLYPAGEDIYYFVRSLMLGDILYIRTPLVKRRHWEGNVSSRLCTKESLDAQQMQFREDIAFAYKEKYISEHEKKMLIKKIKVVGEWFELYNTPFFFSWKTILYRLLMKAFKVKKI